MINSCKTKRPEDKYNKQSLVRRPETSESTISILSYKPLCQGLSRTPTSGKTLPITSLPVKKIIQNLSRLVKCASPLKSTQILFPLVIK